MRQVRLSKTFILQLHDLLEQGYPRFGAAVVAEKRAYVYNLFEHHLAHFPASKKPDAALGLTVYPVTKAPFVILYDFDERELRIHYILHARADRRDLDPTAAEW